MAKAIYTAGSGMLGGVLGVEIGVIAKISPPLFAMGGILACGGAAFFSTFLCDNPNEEAAHAPEERSLAGPLAPV